MKVGCRVHVKVTGARSITCDKHLAALDGAHMTKVGVVVWASTAEGSVTRERGVDLTYRASYSVVCNL